MDKRSQQSYWEKKVSHDFDAMIIGAGFTGLRTALKLKTAQPNWNILVCEQMNSGAAASTKNAGFACFGSPSEILRDLIENSESEVLELLRDRIRGIRNLKQEIARYRLDTGDFGGYECFRKDSHQFTEVKNNLADVNEILVQAGLEQDECYTEQDISSLGLGLHGRAFRNSLEYQIHPGNLHRAILKDCLSHGIAVMHSTEIIDKTKEGKHRIESRDGRVFKGERLIHCSNAYAPMLIEDEEVKPARGQLLLTAPIDGLKLSGNWHLDEGYFYFRNLDGRILLGGGRHLAMVEEESFEQTTTAQIQGILRDLLGTHILPQQHTIEDSWSGIMGIGSNRRAKLRDLGDGEYAAYGLGGMGVALSAELADKLVNLVLG